MSASGSSSNASNTLTNAYDANGNATSLNGKATTIGLGNTLLNDGTWTYTYDADGNVVSQVGDAGGSKAGWEYDFTYDNRNRLMTVTEKYEGQTSQVIAYTYDVFNNLIGRTDTTYSDGTPTGSTTQRYVYDGANVVLAFDGNGNLTDRYLWGPGVNQLLADEHFSLSGSNQLPSAAGTTLWALGDNQNTVRDLVADNGTLGAHIAYSPFGQQVQVSTSYVNSTYSTVVAGFAFGYDGEYTDNVTGDQLHGVRWYDPSSQRWLTPDPAAADENLYRYCGNAPTDGTDPSGFDDWGTVASPPFAVKGIPPLGDSIQPTPQTPQLTPPTPTPTPPSYGDATISNDSAMGGGSESTDRYGTALNSGHGFGTYEVTSANSGSTTPQVLKAVRYISGELYSDLDKTAEGEPYTKLAKLDWFPRIDRTGYHFSQVLRGNQASAEATFFIVFEVAGDADDYKLFLDETGSSYTYRTSTGATRSVLSGAGEKEITKAYDTINSKYSVSANTQGHVPWHNCLCNSLMIYFDKPDVFKFVSRYDPGAQEGDIGVSHTINQVFTVKYKDGKTVGTYKNSVTIDLNGNLRTSNFP